MAWFPRRTWTQLSRKFSERGFNRVVFERRHTYGFFPEFHSPHRLRFFRFFLNDVFLFNFTFNYYYFQLCFYITFFKIYSKSIVGIHHRFGNKDNIQRWHNFRKMKSCLFERAINVTAVNWNFSLFIRK